MRALPLIAVILSLGLSVALGTSGAAAEPNGWSPPRTEYGFPDLQGVWSNASITKLTRPPALTQLIISPAEAAAVAAANPQVRAMKADVSPSDPGRGAPAAGGDISGGFNAGWLDPGATLAKVRGEYRTSWIVDPADGQLPFSEAGKALRAEAAAFARRADAPSNPEDLQPWDRCLISSRGSGGPGMLNNIYNSNYQIVQTPSVVTIVVEMIHDARTIPVFKTKAEAQAAHRPAVIEPWLGDSIGWWEGDVLVVETTHVNREQGRAGPIYLTPQGRVTERFSRTAPDEILYTFVVEDPAYYSQPWRAEMPLKARKDRLFEYACHEGNYALPDILRGARVVEARTAGGAPTGDAKGGNR